MTADVIHLLTGEYPPVPGGVGDYTSQVARGLSERGAEVHVWAPGYATAQHNGGVIVHRSAGRFTRADLWRIGAELDARPGRIILQWVPHAFGRRSMNFALARWCRQRALLSGNRLELMVHEPCCAFGEGKWRQNLVACVHRAMLALLLDGASKVWVSIPKWEAVLRRWCLRGLPDFEWLPVPSNVATAVNAGDVLMTRQQILLPGQQLVGHFASGGRGIAPLLKTALVDLLSGSHCVILLVGRDSDGLREDFLAEYSQFEKRVMSTGALSPVDVARYLSACDLVIQPYPDGVSTRRGTAMAALALGVPMVTNFGHLSEEIWIETHAVGLAACGKDLAGAAMRLLDDPERRARLSQDSRDLYRSRFDLSVTIRALIGRDGARSEAFPIAS